MCVKQCKIILTTFYHLPITFSARGAFLIFLWGKQQTHYLNIYAFKLGLPIHPQKPIIFRDWEYQFTFSVIDHDFTRGWSICSSQFWCFAFSTRPNLEPPIFQGLRPLPLFTFGSLLWRHRVYYTVQTARSARFFLAQAGHRSFSVREATSCILPGSRSGSL